VADSTPHQLPLTLGLDLGARKTQVCVLSPDGRRLEERSVATTQSSIDALLSRFPGARVVLEASTSARWIASLAKGRGHEVIVANPRKIPIVTASIRKCDRNDARLLAELGQVRPELLSPVELREDRYQAMRTLLFARGQLVETRTSMINFVRAEVRMHGYSLPDWGARYFAAKSRSAIPEALQDVLEPIIDVIESLTRRIADYDARIEAHSKTDFGETALLTQIFGVGQLIALAFVATIGDPKRFKHSRSVGAYLGLVPRSSQSGGRNPTLGITKCGDRFLRSLLVSAATRILGPHGPDSDLRRLGMKIGAGGDKRAKAKARIAVARHLAVLMHRLLSTGEVYEPLRNSEPAAA
jgi:transposase